MPFENLLEKVGVTFKKDITVKEISLGGISLRYNPETKHLFVFDLNEQIKYTYLDPETGETKNGTYNKYVMGTFDPMSTLLMPKETEDAKLAAERIYKTAIYAGLERKIATRKITEIDESTSSHIRALSTLAIHLLSFTTDIERPNAIEQNCSHRLLTFMNMNDYAIVTSSCI